MVLSFPGLGSFDSPCQIDVSVFGESCPRPLSFRPRPDQNLQKRSYATSANSNWGKTNSSVDDDSVQSRAANIIAFNQMGVQMFRSTIVTVLSNSIFLTNFPVSKTSPGCPSRRRLKQRYRLFPTNPEEGEEGKVLLSWEFDATKALGEASQRRFVVQFFANDGCDEKGAA